eukprot:792-Chlamydomonas_euryale.AAC.1
MREDATDFVMCENAGREAAFNGLQRRFTWGFVRFDRGLGGAWAWFRRGKVQAGLRWGFRRGLGGVREGFRRSSGGVQAGFRPGLGRLQAGFRRGALRCLPAKLRGRLSPASGKGVR